MCSFFFFKQKTAYEMRISDWSSDVCSSDLERGLADDRNRTAPRDVEERGDRQGSPARPQRPPLAYSPRGAPGAAVQRPRLPVAGRRSAADGFPLLRPTRTARPALLPPPFRTLPYPQRPQQRRTAERRASKEGVR